MIVFNVYEHDTNEVLKWAQHDCYDGGQLNLFRQDQKLEDYYASKWTQWYEDKITELLENPAFVRFVVLAVLHTNTKTGYEFEHRLCGFLTDYFGMQNWNSTVGYVKTYAELKS